jgi:hypothetical protein
LNEKNEKNEKKPFGDMKIQNEDKLNVEYDKEEFQSKFPHLMEELSNKEQSIKIDSITPEIEKVLVKTPSKSEEKIPNELINPGAIDFLRRCTTNEEAFEIIDYLLQRNELTGEEYDELHSKIVQEGGLQKLIEESGGLKKTGYYERKYYKKRYN